MTRLTLEDCGTTPGDLRETTAGGAQSGRLLTRRWAVGPEVHGSDGGRTAGGIRNPRRLHRHPAPVPAPGDYRPRVWRQQRRRVWPPPALGAPPRPRASSPTERPTGRLPPTVAPATTTRSSTPPSAASSSRAPRPSPCGRAGSPYRTPMHG